MIACAQADYILHSASHGRAPWPSPRCRLRRKNAIGIGVLGGMIVGALLGLFFIPVFSWSCSACSASAKRPPRPSKPRPGGSTQTKPLITSLALATSLFVSGCATLQPPLPEAAAFDSGRMATAGDHSGSRRRAAPGGGRIVCATSSPTHASINCRAGARQQSRPACRGAQRPTRPLAIRHPRADRMPSLGARSA